MGVECDVARLREAPTLEDCRHHERPAQSAQRLLRADYAQSRARRSRAAFRLEQPRSNRPADQIAAYDPSSHTALENRTAGRIRRPGGAKDFSADSLEA